MITHLMMDIDGVVITGRPQDGLPWKTQLESDLGLSPQMLHDQFFVPYWAEIVTGRRDLRTTLGKVLDSIEPDLTADTLIDYWFANDARQETAVLRDMQVIRSSGLAVCFATNQDAHRTSYLLNEMGLAEHADLMLSSSELGVAKPSTSFFTQAAVQTGAAPAAHLLIDDSIENVEAARLSGWNAHHWTGEKSLIPVVQGFRPD